MEEPTLSALWWEESDERKIHESAIADFDTLRSSTSRPDRYNTYERIYRNESIDRSETLTSELTRFGVDLKSYSRASYNLIATATDNIVSRIVRNKPRAVYQVSGGNWSLRRVAKMQQKWVDHMAHKMYFPRIANVQVRDGVLLGNGHSKVFKRYGVNEVSVAHVHPSDVFVDPVEVMYGEPRRMMQRMFCSKDAARRMFKHPELIDDSSVMSTEAFMARQGQLDSPTPILSQVEIIEAWHLPSLPDADDGRHIIFCEAGLLYSEPWEREDFPILSYQWKSRPGDSFHGIAVPEEILGIHLDLNFSLQQIYETAELTASPIVLSPQSAGMSRAEFTDMPGSLWEYNGNVPPTIIQPPKVQMDMLQLVHDQEARAYRRLGLDSATPNDPSPGLETGRAVRMDFDARSMAFALALQNFENLYKDFGDKCTSAGRQIWEKDKSFSVVVPRNKYTVEDVPWEDVALNPRKHSFTVQVTAGSQLSQHPAGRIDDVANLVNMGAVTEITEIRALTGLSDLEHSNSMATAAREAVEQMCEEMLDDGIEHRPEPYDDLDLCMSIANAWYLRARTQGAPEDRLDIMRSFLDQVNVLISQRDVQRAAQAQGMVPSGTTPPAPDAAGQNPSAMTQGI